MTRSPGKLRSAVQRVSATAQARIEDERERRFIVGLTFALVDRGRKVAAPVLAGALAFRLFLTLLPLTLVLVVGLGFLKSAGGSPSDALQQFGIKGALAATIDHSASFKDPGRAVVLLLGLGGVFTGARASVAALRAAHALAWGIPVGRWRRNTTAATIFLSAAIVAFACAGVATRVRNAAGVPLGFGASILLSVVVAGVWLGVSRLLPHRDAVTWTALLPGAILIGIGFAVLQTITVNWIGPKLDHDSSLYGSMGVAFVVLGWLYVVGRLIVTAPMLNAALLERRDHGRSQWAK